MRSAPAGLFRSNAAPGTARWQLTQPLGPEEGLAVVLTFPKGLVVAPTRSQKITWFLKDNRGVLVALLGLIVLLVYCVRRWLAVGRDPRAGIIIARYAPPEGHSPGGLRYMKRMGYDSRCFSSDLLAMAVGGLVRIHRDKGFLRDDWKLERVDTTEDWSRYTDAQRLLLGNLFSNGETIELETENATTLQSAQTAHTKALDARFQPKFFQRHVGSLGIAILILIVSMVLAGMVSGGAGMLVIIGIGALMVVVTVVFGWFLDAPTPEGRKLLDQIEGLKLYLGVAEREELARMQGPDGPPHLDAARYEQLLPYAVALDVEDAWTKKFTLAVGEAAAAATTSAISWYHGGSFDSASSLSNAVGNALGSQIASSSTPPGSSSGGGGGGSSGGGGGGGGGGGR